MRRLADIQERAGIAPPPIPTGKPLLRVVDEATWLREKFADLYDRIHAAQDALAPEEYAVIQKELDATHDAMADTYIALEKLARAAKEESA